MFTSIHSFYDSAFYALLTGEITAIPATSAGFLSWWINYNRQSTRIFRNKIAFSVLLAAVGALAIFLRFSNPNMAAASDIVYIACNVLIFADLPIVLFIAYEGGRITWPS